MKTNLLRTSLAALLLASIPGYLSAQTTAPADATPPKDEVLVLDPYRIDSGVAPEQLILPIARPFNSVFGTDDNIVDVPRNVTIISRQQLSDINISSVLDFAKLTSSSYTTTNFGAPSNPSIRGQTADLFINGVRGRITSNGNGLPLDFNSVESVNIVKGPATAVQGTSMYVGGFVDLITKRPYFDKTKGSVSVTIGSYSQKEWTVDVGGPISKEVAYRFSYSGTDSKGYWHDYFNKNHSVYGALTFRLSSNYEIFVNSTLADYRYTENWGINRPTQDLIDNGHYRTGVNNNPAPGFYPGPTGFSQYLDANGNRIGFGTGAGGTDVIATVAGTPAPQSDPQNSQWVTSGFPYENRIAFGPTVSISRHARLLKPGDHSKGKEYNAQAIQTYTASSEFKVVNNTYFSYTSRNTKSSYYYSEVIDPSWFAENRTELIFTKPKYTINAGLDLRYQRTKAYDDYFFEPANVWDITKDLTYVNVYNSVNFPNPFTSLPIPGWPNRYATDGITNGDTNDSHGTTVGPFAQGTWKISDKASFVAGARYDHLSAHNREPLLTSHPEASISLWLPNYNGSVVYKPTATSSVYATYNYSKNTSGAVGNGGGINGWNSAGTGMDKQLFQQPSELIEVGTKYALSENKLFLNFAIYDQKRTAKNTSSLVVSKYHAKGFEAEMNYQPSKKLYATLSYSYSNIKSTAPQPQLDGSVGDFYSSTNADGRVSGLPQHSINGLISYTFDNGWGVSANTLLTSSINNNFTGTLKIPAQYEIDASVWYHYKQWDYRVSVGNVTDQKNWAPPNVVYGNASIYALAGTTVSLNIKYNF